MVIKQVFVSSENRDKDLYPNGNSYSLHITQPIKDIHRVELLYASVPNTMYNLTNGGNVIKFSNVISTTDDPLTTFSLPKGFYSSHELSEQLNNTINNITGIQVSYLRTEGKFLFRRPEPFSLEIDSEELSSILGFENNKIYESSNVTESLELNIPLYSNNTIYNGQDFIKSENMVDLLNNQGIFLDVEELQTYNTEDAKSLTGNTYSGGNIRRTFGLIPLDVPSGTIKTFKKSTDYDLFCDYAYPIKKLDRLTIKWIGRFGQTVNFNGSDDNSFLLRFYTLEKNMQYI